MSELRHTLGVDGAGGGGEAVEAVTEVRDTEQSIVTLSGHRLLRYGHLRHLISHINCALCTLNYTSVRIHFTSDSITLRQLTYSNAQSSIGGGALFEGAEPPLPDTADSPPPWQPLPPEAEIPATETTT
ncbi:hypothetical protein GCM10009637_14240 [Brevibacterium luteolum]